MKILYFVSLVLLLGACASNTANVDEGAANEAVAETQRETAPANVVTVQGIDFSDHLANVTILEYITEEVPGWDELELAILQYNHSSNGELVLQNRKAIAYRDGLVLKFLDKEYILLSENAKLVIVVEDLNSVYPSQHDGAEFQWLRVKEN